MPSFAEKLCNLAMSQSYDRTHDICFLNINDITPGFYDDLTRENCVGLLYTDLRLAIQTVLSNKSDLRQSKTIYIFRDRMNFYGISLTMLCPYMKISKKIKKKLLCPQSPPKYPIIVITRVIISRETEYTILQENLKNIITRFFPSDI